MIIFSLKSDGISADAKIITVQMKIGTIRKIWKIWEYENEEKMLENFIEYFLKLIDKIIVGYNILKFDIPILLLKTRKLPNFQRFFMKLNSANIEDLFIILTFLNKGKIKSFDEYCKDYGITEANVKSDEIINLYKNGKYEEVEKAVLSNLENLNTLFSKVWNRIVLGKTN